MDWHRRSTTDVLSELNTNTAQGLPQTEADSRLVTYGPNELTERGGRSPFRILWEQLTATMVLILIAALEATQGSANWLWYVGIIYIFGRLAHGLGMDGGTLGKGRMVGTLITLLTLLGLAGYALWSVYSKLG